MKGFPFQGDSLFLRVVTRSAAGFVVVAGLFCVVMGVLTAANYARMRSADPLNDPTLVQMREEYARTGNDELKQRIRALDLVLREDYFARRAQVRTGSILLLIGCAVLVGALKIEALAAKKLPVPEKNDEEDSSFASLASARKGIVFAGLACGAAAAILGLAAGRKPDYSSLADSSGDRGENGSKQQEYIFPSGEEIEKNWPSFRGPYGLARAHEKVDPPLEWSRNPATNIAWAADIPRSGFSSPVIWEDRIFVTGGDKKAREVYCFNAGEGGLLWRREVGGYPGSPETMPEVTEDTGLAAPTPATDGQSVIAVFGTGDIACFSTDGEEQWGRNLGVPEINYGYASSPMIFRDKVIIQYHQDVDSRFMALDIRTGEQLWVRWQDARASWASPVLLPGEDEPMVVISGNPLATLHSLASGKKQWQAEVSGGEPAPSPTYASGRIITASDYMGIAAIKLDSGNVAWQNDLIALPSVSSPLAVGGLVFICSSYGTVTCLDAETADSVWTHDFSRGFYSSPVLAGGRIYAVDRDGVTHIFKPKRQYEPVADIPLKEPVDSTPAFKGGHMYLRSRQKLYCVAREAADDK